MTCHAPEAHALCPHHGQRSGVRVTFRDGCVAFWCGYPFPRDDEPSCAWGAADACVCQRATCADGSTSGVWPSAARPCPVPLHTPGIVSLVAVDRDGIPFDRESWTPADVLGNMVRESTRRPR